MSQLHVEQLNGLKISALLLRTKGQAEALRIWLRPGEQKDSSSAGVRCVDSLWKEPAICANSLLRVSRARRACPEPAKCAQCPTLMPRAVPCASVARHVAQSLPHAQTV